MQVPRQRDDGRRAVTLGRSNRDFYEASWWKERMNIDSFFRGQPVALVYQAPDQPCFVIVVEMNHGSLYGDLVIARIDSTP
jgi:hypothetical protein